MPEALNEKVSKLKAALETIEREVIVGSATADTLEEFKMAIDHIRISVWAILTEQHAGGHQSIVARYRVKRIKEMCRHLMQDIEVGLIPLGDPELEVLRDVLEETAAHVTRLIEAVE